jgi:hypothetical protein
MYQGLQDKNIVTISAADPEGKVLTITIRKAAWKQLKKPIFTRLSASPLSTDGPP